MNNLRTEKIALVVDDDSMTRILVSTILKKNNFHVFEGENGVEAISQFISTRPSLIVIDMNMPIMDGCNAASIIRNMRSGNHCNIILFTSEEKELILRNSTCKSVDIVINKKNVNELREHVRSAGMDNLDDGVIV